MLSIFLFAFADLLNIVLKAYTFMIIARAVLSWVNPDPYNPVVRFLTQTTEPVLSRIRRVVPPMGGFDLSPMLLILAIVFLQSFLGRALQQIAFELR